MDDARPRMGRELVLLRGLAAGALTGCVAGALLGVVVMLASDNVDAWEAEVAAGLLFGAMVGALVGAGVGVVASVVVAACQPVLRTTRRARAAGALGAAAGAALVWALAPGLGWTGGGFLVACAAIGLGVGPAVSGRVQE